MRFVPPLPAGADASFEMEDFLLSRGAEINRRDKHGRVPMHYAFIKIGHPVENQTSAIDPIETISSLCAVKGKLNFFAPSRQLPGRVVLSVRF